MKSKLLTAVAALVASVSASPAFAEEKIIRVCEDYIYDQHQDLIDAKTGECHAFIAEVADLELGTPDFDEKLAAYGRVIDECIAELNVLRETPTEDRTRPEIRENCVEYVDKRGS